MTKTTAKRPSHEYGNLSPYPTVLCGYSEVDIKRRKPETHLIVTVENQNASKGLLMHAELPELISEQFRWWIDEYTMGFLTRKLNTDLKMA